MNKNDSGAQSNNPGNSKKLTPLLSKEQALQHAKTGIPDWYETRRKLFPADKSVAGRARTYISLPKTYIDATGVQKLSAFVPPEAMFSLRPQIIERPPIKYLKRFSGEDLIPLDSNSELIIGDDGRKVFSDASYPMCCIGQLDFRDGSAGTAVLVGEYFILTADHVVNGEWLQGGPVQHMEIKFTPAMNLISPGRIGSLWVMIT